jgi:hypothetical protein
MGKEPGIFCSAGERDYHYATPPGPGVNVCPLGVVQWTSHPPQEREDPGSNPARVHVRFLGKHSSAVIYKMT